MSRSAFELNNRENIEMLCLVLPIVERQIVVKTVVVHSKITAEHCGMSGEDSLDRHVFLADVHNRNARHPFVEMSHNVGRLNVAVN